MTRWLSLLVVLLLLNGCARPIVQYPTHHERVLVSEVPGDVLKTFYSHCPQAEIVSVTKVTGGETGTALIFYAFRFMQNSRLREALIHRPGDTAPFIYDIRK